MFPTMASDSAVLLGLRWLAQAQNMDGSLLLGPLIVPGSY
jgi:hypothetical protein